MNQSLNIEKLNQRLKEELPGRISHEKMTPKRNGVPFRPVKVPMTARSSAVMLLINKPPTEATPQILLTLRSSKLRTHSGQISFPGGKIDDGETPIKAAIRETHEETGIIINENNIIGSISQLFVPHSNAAIMPFLAYTEQFHQLKLNPDEVEEAWFEPLDSFLGERNLREEVWNLGGYNAEVPFWKIHNSMPLWGATAVILREFLDILES